MYDIAIVGAGTAGLTAAIYGARAGKKVLLFESYTYGGQIINSLEVENYPGIKNISGTDFAIALYEQATALGAEIEMAQVTGIRAEGAEKAVFTDGKEYPCRTIILATGAKNRPLGLEREDKLTGAGVSYCATCDGAFFKGKDVAVVGGGNTALEDASFLAEYCKKVYLIHRRDTFRGEDKLVDMLKAKTNVEFVLNSTVTKLLGDQRLSGIEITNSITSETGTLDVEGIFIAVGQIPENQMFSPPIELDVAGYIVAGEDCKTNIPGVFTAGDCRTKAIRQLSTAAADGTVSALGAVEYILKNA